MVGDDVTQLFVGNAQRSDHVTDHPYPTGSDGPHRELLMAWHSQLPHQHYVEGCLERLGYHVPYRHSTTGQGEDDEIG